MELTLRWGRGATVGVRRWTCAAAHITHIMLFSFGDSCASIIILHVYYNEGIFNTFYPNTNGNKKIEKLCGGHTHQFKVEGDGFSCMAIL